MNMYNLIKRSAAPPNPLLNLIESIRIQLNMQVLSEILRFTLILSEIMLILAI